SRCSGRMRVQGPCLILVIILWLSLGFKSYCNAWIVEGFPEDFLCLILPAEGMMVNFVDVFFHLNCQCGSDFAAAGLALQMCCIGLELRIEIVEHGTTPREFLIVDNPLKFCVAFIHFGFECGGVETFFEHGKLVDKIELEITETFNPHVVSALTAVCLAPFSGNIFN